MVVMFGIERLANTEPITDDLYLLIKSCSFQHQLD